MKKTTTRKTKTIKKKPSVRITKDMIISDVVRDYPELATVFLEHGLHCVGCAIAQFDTIEAGALSHGIHPDYLLKDLNARAAKKKRA